MHAPHLFRHANFSLAPERRVTQFLQGEERLTWTSLLFSAFPNAQIFLVGGTVRDLLLGRLPKDLDLVVRGVPEEELYSWLLTHGSAERIEKFGTYKFIPHGARVREPIDIALPRREFLGPDHKSGRNDMKIEYDEKVTIKEDLSRRDFTVNAMAFDLEEGHLIDPFLGIRDLEEGMINAVLIPEQRFFEDATRILRGLRLACQLGFAIEHGTWEAMLEGLPLLNTTVVNDEGKYQYHVPRSTIGREFLLGFLEHPVRAMRLWAEAGALHLYLPELAIFDGEDDFETHVAEKTQRLLHLLTNRQLLAHYELKRAPANVLVSALLVYASFEEAGSASRICTSLHFHQFGKNHYAHVDCDEVLWLVKNARYLEDHDPASLRPSEFEALFAGPRGANLLLLIHAMHLAEDRFSVARERLHVARRLRASHAQIAPTVTKLLRGEDLASLGLAPGPQYRHLLSRVRDAQLTGAVTTKEQALSLAAKIAHDEHLLS